MSYSALEIEQKRLMALELRKSRMQQKTTVVTSTPITTGPLKVANVSPEFRKRQNDTRFSAVIKPKQIKLVDAIPPNNFFNKSETIKGTCSMITENRFEVNVGYHEPLINYFRKFATKLYDQKTRLWSFNIKEYDKLMHDLKSELPNVVLEGLPNFVLQMFTKQASDLLNSQTPDLSRVDKHLLDTLMPFQREGIIFGIRMNGRCIIADDMGLGKTIQALGLAHYYQNDWPLLIVTPSSVRYQWSEAIFEFLPSVPVQQVHQFITSKDTLGSEKITIVSYEILVRSIEVFMKKKFGMVILDESHGLKSHKTARTKAVERVTAQASRIILLSGTPALSRPIELYSQVRLLFKKFMPIHEYGVRYCAAIMSKFGMNYTGSSNTRELQLLLKASCLIRRLKTEVLKQLPAKIRQVVILDPALVTRSSKKMKEMANKLQECKNNGFESHNTLLHLYNESSTQRLKAVSNYIKDLLENDQKFLVFAHHQNVLDSICEVLYNQKVKCIRIDGKTTPTARKEYVDKFQNCDDCKVAVLSITAANAGITLTAAHFVVFAELFWNPGILCQAEDRVHRIGQDSSVFIQYLVAKGTVDDYLWPLVQKKLDFLSKAGLHQDFSLNEADVVQQQQSVDEPSNQTTLDNFVIASPIKHENSSHENSTETQDDSKKLLDEDEDAFANLDFDDFE